MEKKPWADYKTYMGSDDTAMIAAILCPWEGQRKPAENYRNMDLDSMQCGFSKSCNC